MKISIITVVRNAESQVEAALQSVAVQTYPEIEYIVIDGDSQDSTKDIIRQYAHHITHFISEPDDGVYQAMNKGIRLASGDFIFFLNSDDRLIDDKVVQDVANFLQAHPECDFVYGDLLFVVHSSGKSSSQLVSFPQPDGLLEHLISDCLLHQASFSRTSLFQKLGHFSEQYRIGSDYEWFLKLISEGGLNLRYFPRVIASYNAGGMSSDMSRTLSEMFDIQNKAPIYQSVEWLKKRIIKYQDILRDPQGRFGLNRNAISAYPWDGNEIQAQMLSFDTSTTIQEKERMQTRIQNLKQKVHRLKAENQLLMQQLKAAQSTISAMETSKFWKLRSAWFQLKGILPSSKESKPESTLPSTLSIKEEESLVSNDSQRTQTEQDVLFAKLRDPKVRKSVSCSPEDGDYIVRQFQQAGINVTDYTVDIEGYRQYFQAARYEQDFPNYYSFNLPEKSLEHYIATMLLDPNEHDVYVDIASEGSPVPEIYSNLFGTKVYRQDLAYPDGINGNLIGGDAANMPVPDGFATKMALHCSLEHFEGNSDIGFVKELSRVLSPGGSVCIVPLYLAKSYSIQTDPTVSVPSQVSFEEDAILHCAFGWGNRHGRFYDPSHFISRIYQNLNGMTLSIYRIRNAQEVDPSCYVQFAALIKKPI